MHAELDAYPVVLEIPVIWGDQDAFHHVNNLVYLRWMEQARATYLQRLGFKLNGTVDNAPIIASVNCRYKAPVNWPDTVWVGARISQMQEDRFTHHYRVVSAELGRVAAEGEAVCVWYDHVAKSKATAPADWLETLKHLEPELVAQYRSEHNGLRD